MASKILLIITTFFICVSAFGAPEKRAVTIAMALELDGKLVSQPRMVLLSGQTGEITQQSEGKDAAYSIEVQPSINKYNSVQIDFVVSQNIGGKAEILSRPRMVVLNGQAATIEQKPTGRSGFKLTVTPTF